MPGGRRSHRPMDDFYLRLYIGQQKEFIEVEVGADGELRYVNQSKYRGEEAIRKRLYVSPTVLTEIARIVRAADVTGLDDAQWPLPFRDSRQELEVRLVSPSRQEGADPAAPNVEHISLATEKLASTVQMLRCGGDLEGLKRFFYLCQDLKALFLALVAAHFQVQPI